MISRRVKRPFSECAHARACVSLTFCDHGRGPWASGSGRPAASISSAGWWGGRRPGGCVPGSGTGSSPRDGGLADAAQAHGLERACHPLHSSIPCSSYLPSSLEGLLRKPFKWHELPEGGSCGASQRSPAQGLEVSGSWRPKSRPLGAQGARHWASSGGSALSVVVLVSQRGLDMGPSPHPFSGNGTAGAPPRLVQGFRSRFPRLS